MKKETYIRMTQPCRDHPELALMLEWGNRILTVGIFLGYPVILFLLWYRRRPELLQTILVPLVGFVLVTVFRKIVNRKRPYEKFDLPPILDKDTKGKSFPSRHVFSAMIIALAVLSLPGFSKVGLAMVAATYLIGILRILGGVHYPSDVVAGVLAAIAISLMGSWCNWFK